MPRAGPRKVQRYSLEFKLKAVKLSQLQGIEDLRHQRFKQFESVALGRENDGCTNPAQQPRR
ncbi:MAG: hypothetical protein ABMA15_25965 [Vicinamibacterales bacterium]